MRFLSDENIEFSITVALKRLGIDIVAIDETGNKGAGDKEILAFARENRRVVITRDSDFLKLHSKGAEHAGIIFIPDFLPIGVIVKEIERVSLLFNPEDIQNSVIFVPLK